MRTTNWTRWIEGVILAVAAVLLPIIVSGSELVLFVAVITAAVSLVTLFRPQTWLASIVTLFSWSMLALYLHQLGGGWQLFSIIMIYMAGIAATVFVTSYREIAHLSLGMAVGIVMAELFILLLFWPINFPSRSLIITIAGYFILEILTTAKETGLSWRSMMAPLTLSTVSVIAIVITADWFEF